MYPAGAAKCGALDMSGNVWEWCLNENKAPENIAVSGDTIRVVRGGSWRRRRGDARASSRDGYIPRFRSVDFGFRVIARPPSL